MADPLHFCETHNGPICQGVNGFKSVVNGFLGDGENTSAPPTTSNNDTPQATPPPAEVVTSAPETTTQAPPPLPPPPPPQLAPAVITASSPAETATVSSASRTSTVTDVIAPPPPPDLLSPPPQEPSTSTPTQSTSSTPLAALTSTSSRGSFIEVLPTRTPTAFSLISNPIIPSIFVSSGFTSVTVSPGTTALSPATETVTAQPLISPGTAQGAISDRTTEFPAALVGGVSGGVVAFIVVFALFWRYCLRKQYRSRHAQSVADEKGLDQTLDHFPAPPLNHGVTTHISKGSPFVEPDHARFSLAATEVSLDSNLEPLSPKPAIQQTVYRMSVPVPVEASSFRANSKEGSMRGSFSPPSSTHRQTILREPPARQGRESIDRLSTRPPRPGTDSYSRREDLPAQAEEAKETGESQQIQGSSSPGGEGPGWQRQYTLRTSPLHQNPFKDPAENEIPVESPTSMVFEIVNADTPPVRVTLKRLSEPQDEDFDNESLYPARVLEKEEQPKK
ncbi:hypothetical protein N8I77_011460 [Diaporthe amygdali]|uniref:Uncharacterized protein n=1 Tax=Phomopsis amygdali TaxID=1214568 RepID=A0AAD9S6T4_PHOAM|nr:hypothetical protein N8I77_011460 [Diaporthe amygdali]